MFNMKDYKSNLAKVMAEGELNTCLVCQNVDDFPYVVCNAVSKYKEENVSKYNAVVTHAYHNGGVIILFPEDIGFTWYSSEDILDRVINKIIKFLKTFSDQIWRNGNDVMFGEKKLFGCSTNGNGPYYQGMFFSFNADVSVIRDLSAKESVKEPVGLSVLGVTPDQIKTLIAEIIEEYNLKDEFGGVE